MTQKRGAQIISLREAGARVRAHRRSVAEELKRPIAPDPRRSALIQLIFVLLLVGEDCYSCTCYATSRTCRTA